MTTLAAAPASLVIGAGGSVGSQDWMKAALLLQSVGQDPRNMRYVSFEGGGEAATALLGGHIDVFAGDFGEMKSHLGDNRYRILAVLAEEERLPAPADHIPTATEQGYDVVWRVIRGFYMGRDVPDASYRYWVEAFRQAFDAPRYLKLQPELGLLPLNKAGDEVREMVTIQVQEMRRLAREMGLIE